jgi:flagellar hook-basal body complex protein FliE
MSTSITPVSHFNFASEMKEAASGAEQAGGSSFASFLGKSIDQVDTMLKAADQKSTELAVGKTENLHDAMITVEKAETALKLMMQVRNKALEAYHEVMRMQV